MFRQILSVKETPFLNFCETVKRFSSTVFQPEIFYWALIENLESSEIKIIFAKFFMVDNFIIFQNVDYDQTEMYKYASKYVFPIAPFKNCDVNKNLNHVQNLWESI